MWSLEVHEEAHCLPMPVTQGLVVPNLLCLSAHPARVLEMGVSGLYRRLIQQPVPMTLLCRNPTGLGLALTSAWTPVC